MNDHAKSYNSWLSSYVYQAERDYLQHQSLPQSLPHECNECPGYECNECFGYDRQETFVHDAEIYIVSSVIPVAVLVDGIVHSDCFHTALLRDLH